jgi:hypothetical protein
MTHPQSLPELPAIEVFNLRTGEVVHTIPCDSEHKAEKALCGLLRQIDSERYGASIRSRKEQK